MISRRVLFREAVFRRDADRCRVCGAKAIDAHHVMPREELTRGGYVAENGVALCGDCRLLAEAGIALERLRKRQVHQADRVDLDAWGIDALYASIGSSREIAAAASLRAAHEG